MSTTTDHDLDDNRQEDHDWGNPPGGLPLPRRRRRWLTPGSTLLLALTLGFVGFYAGVREEKANATGSGSTGSSSPRSLPRAGAATPGAAGGVTAGTVSRVDGDTLYIKEPSGETVQVKLLSTTSINKSLSISGHSVRPGDTVTVQGTKGSGGTIKSSSIGDSGSTGTRTTTTSQADTSTSSG